LLPARYPAIPVTGEVKIELTAAIAAFFASSEEVALLRIYKQKYRLKPIAANKTIVNAIVLKTSILR
jgi:hypothetical protein